MTCVSELKKRQLCTIKIIERSKLSIFLSKYKIKLIICFRIRSRPIVIRTRTWLTSNDRCDERDNHCCESLNFKSRDARETVEQGGRSFEKATRTDCDVVMASEL